MTGEHVKRVVPVGALLVIVLAVLGGASGAGARAGSVLFFDNFNRANGPNSLITNEYADRNPGDSHAVRSKSWETTSGSFFVKRGVGWTGVPDGCRPDRYSKVCNDSSVFRLHTRRRDFGDDWDVRSARSPPAVTYNDACLSSRPFSSSVCSVAAAVFWSPRRCCCSTTACGRV